MGGIRIDVHCRTSLDGLFAAGEDTGGVHGANRLGGNGVADSIVFGARAGDTMVEDVSRRSLVVSGEITAQVQEVCKRWMQPLERDGGENSFQLRDRLERTMWNKVGVVRNAADMQLALPEIQEIRERIKTASAALAPHSSLPAPIYNAPWNEAINTENLSLIAEMLTRSALAREESRGAHYRSDFPDKDPRWLTNICMKRLENGTFEMEFTPVAFTRLTPEELRVLTDNKAGLKSIILDDE
jgi:succinate dehydrogenase / fumarate reductase flavoprotein subunit/fumarate reductase flavoprotein subunit